MAVPVAEREHAERTARAAARDLVGAPAEEIVGWAAETFGDRLCLAASMADAVLIHLASRVKPGIDVVFLDTGYHFAETIGTRDAVAATYPVTLHTILPKQTVAEQDALFGPHLHERDPDACCSLRKVEPLRRALEPYHAWANGIRRSETLNRREIGVVEWDSNRGLVKINPIAGWSDHDVDAYVAEHGVLVNPLVSEGYPSVGCAPCTRKVASGADPRSGRWAGSTKTECGIHLT